MRLRRAGFRSSLLLPLVFCLVSVCLSPSLTAQVLVRVGDDAPVVGLAQTPQTLWLATKHRILYYVDGGSLEERQPADGIKNDDRTFRCIARVGESLWIGASDGVFEIGEGPYTRVPLGAIDSLSVSHIIADAGGVWIGTKNGIFYKGEEVSGFSEFRGRLSYMGMVGETLWMSNRDNTFRYTREKRTFEPLGSEHAIPSVVDVVAVGKHIYLLSFPGVAVQEGRPTTYDLYRYPDHLNEPMEEGVSEITSIDGVLWFSVPGGRVYSYDAQGAVTTFAEPGIDIPIEVRTIAGTERHIWLLSINGIYRRTKGQGEFKPLALKNYGFSFREVSEFPQSGVWLWGEGGAFRLHEDVELAARLNLAPNPLNIFRTLMIGTQLKVRQAFYVKDGKRWPHPVGEGFEAIVATDAEDFESRKRNLRYDPVPGPVHIPKVSDASVYVAVRDQYGNVQDPPEYDEVMFLAPSKFVWPVAIAVTAVILIALSPGFPLPASWRLHLYLFVVTYYPAMKRLVPSCRYSRHLLRGILAEKMCGQRPKGALSREHSEYSEASRPPIPRQADHRFRGKPTTDSEASRPVLG